MNGAGWIALVVWVIWLRNGSNYVDRIISTYEYKPCGQTYYIEHVLKRGKNEK